MVVLWNYDVEGFDVMLYVVVGDKWKFIRVLGEFMINGNVEVVIYLWFEYLVYVLLGIFICICSCRCDYVNYWVDIDVVIVSVLLVWLCR